MKGNIENTYKFCKGTSHMEFVTVEVPIPLLRVSQTMGVELCGM